MSQLNYSPATWGSFTRLTLTGVWAGLEDSWRFQADISAPLCGLPAPTWVLPHPTVSSECFYSMAAGFPEQKLQDLLKFTTGTSTKWFPLQLTSKGSSQGSPMFKRVGNWMYLLMHTAAWHMRKGNDGSSLQRLTAIVLLFQMRKLEFRETRLPN